MALAAAAGITTLAVTDHDTVGGCARAAAACDRARIEFVPGIEITAILDDADIHVLGYFIDTESATLHDFLGEQRRHRVDRLRLMVERLQLHGVVLDAEAILAPALADPTTSVGRPWIARALVAARYVADMREAFDKWLARGRPAFVPRMGGSPPEVFGRIHDARGLASLAHPGLVGRINIDDWIPQFAAAGLDALEVYHSDHDQNVTARYREIANRLGLAVSGGSDYHADPSHGTVQLGSVSLPADAYKTLKARRRSG